MVPHENFVIVVLVVNRDVWLHDVEAVAVDGVDELQQFLVNQILAITEANVTYRNTERPDIRRCSPWQLHLSFGASENWTTDVVSIFGMSGLLAHSRPKVCKLGLGDLSLRFICVVDEHVVRFHVCLTVSDWKPRGSLTGCCRLTSVDVAFGMERSQSLKDAFRN